MKQHTQELSNLAHNVAWIRKNNKLSKREMAKILGIGISSLNSIEKGIIPPRLDIQFLFNIYDTFGIHPANMFKSKF